jgi:hypothetical protein
MPLRLRDASVAAALTLTLAAPAAGQGKSQQSHGKGGQGKPSQSVLPVSAGGGAGAPTGAAATPFAWIDNAALLPAGTVWIGLSMTRWQGGGLSEVDVPVVDAAVGLTPRVQFGASVPRIAGDGTPDGSGGIGTTFFNAKVAVYANDRRRLSVAAAPTIEVLSQRAAIATGDGRARAQFGVPVSLDVAHGLTSYYGSAGYFSPGIWFAGAGAARAITDRIGASVGVSRAWSSPLAADPTVAGPSRNEVTGGVSVTVTPHVGIFGSLGRTIGTSAEEGAGTTVSVGLSLTAATGVFTR